MLIAAMVLAILLAVAVLAVGVPKALALKTAVDQTVGLGLDLRVMRLTGVFEVLGGVGLIVGLVGKWLGIAWAVWLGAAAAVGLVVLMVLALGFHVTKRDPVQRMVPSAVLLVLSAAVLATWLMAM
ncbi:DoxX family protein [Nocardiopsis rhodophaea]|uniref:DoxX family protein n=1 Tax=Nocardiopsis rhodophaea TaxID=280238 RepID=UPI0031D1EEDD